MSSRRSGRMRRRFMPWYQVVVRSTTNGPARRRSRGTARGTSTSRPGMPFPGPLSGIRVSGSRGTTSCSADGSQVACDWKVPTSGCGEFLDSLSATGACPGWNRVTGWRERAAPPDNRASGERAALVTAGRVRTIGPANARSAPRVRARRRAARSRTPSATSGRGRSVRRATRPGRVHAGSTDRAHRSTVPGRRPSTWPALVRRVGGGIARRPPGG